MNRVDLVGRYLLNNRLDDYFKILAYAKENEYQIISLARYVNKQFNQDKKVLILRHDIDHINKGTELMFEIEKAAGAYASYYFRHCTEDGTLIKKIRDYGSEVSLHFETIADYAKENNITSKEVLYHNDFRKICLVKLKQDLELFRTKYNLLCETIASHGEFINRVIETPNNTLTEDQSVYDYLNIRMEAYNAQLINSFNIYISDTVMEINNGYIYGCDPINAMKDKDNKVILFLTHPNHWYYSPWQRIRKIVKCLIKAPVDTNREFRRI